MKKEQSSNQFLLENSFGSRARVKIIKTLANNLELSISKIIDNTQLNYKCVLKHLKYLKNLNLIQEKNFGRIRIFRFKVENFKANCLKKFITIWESPELDYSLE